MCTFVGRPNDCKRENLRRVSVVHDSVPCDVRAQVGSASHLHHRQFCSRIHFKQRSLHTPFEFVPRLSPRVESQADENGCQQRHAADDRDADILKWVVFSHGDESGETPPGEVEVRRVSTEGSMMLVVVVGTDSSAPTSHLSKPKRMRTRRAHGYDSERWERV